MFQIKIWKLFVLNIFFKQIELNIKFPIQGEIQFYVKMKFNISSLNLLLCWIGWVENKFVDI